MRTARIAVLSLVTVLAACTASSDAPELASSGETPPRQAAPPPPPPPAPPPPPLARGMLSDQEASVAVTGSRMPSPYLNSNSPVVSVDQSSLGSVAAGLPAAPAEARG